MKKNLPRSNLYKIPEFSLQYNPNKEIVMPSIIRDINFNKISKRKNLFPIEKSPEFYNVNYKSIEKSVSTVDFSKSKPRILNEASPFPSYMQSVHSRTSLGFKSFKESNIGFDETNELISSRS